MSLFKAEYELKVSFEDIDLMGIVWHGNYIKYLEQARCDMFSKLNYTYMDMKDDGFGYPVAKMKVKYVKPAKFEDVLVVKSELVELEPAMNIKYAIFNKFTEEKIFEAKTMQIAFDIKANKSVYTPPKRFIEAIKRQNQ